MSRVVKSTPTPSAKDDAGPPFVGALLRLCLERVRARIREAVRAAGFTDLQDAYLAVFSYPLPDGVRPSELARRIRMSRQATNYLIAQMEALGYLERRTTDGDDGARRRVYFTKRAWRVNETIVACLRELQAEWEGEIGQKRFRAFIEVLRHFADEELRSYSR
ncbi:MAG: MarR family transcriptional regulator [Hyphomicrobiales bacterium]|nr:MarR family transcriptional regulator [Hyphomicrobiales bacterium]